MVTLNDIERTIISEGHKWVAQEKQTTHTIHEHGLQKTPWKKTFAFKAVRFSTAARPTSWDWREHGGDVYVIDQEQCGSCVAASLTRVVGSNLKIELKQPTLYPDISIWDLFRRIGTCDTGANFEDALKAAQDGICDTACCPYQYTNPVDPCADRANRLYKIGGYQLISTEDELKDALYLDGPVEAGIDVYPSFEYYKSGVWTRLSTDITSLGGHGIMIVGYHDADPSIPGDVGYWIIQNSWGTVFGEAGFIRVAYDANIGLLDAANGYPAYSVSGCTGPSVLPPVPPTPPTPSNNINIYIVAGIVIVVLLLGIGIFTGII